MGYLSRSGLPNVDNSGSEKALRRELLVIHFRPRLPDSGDFPVRRLETIRPERASVRLAGRKPRSEWCRGTADSSADPEVLRICSSDSSLSDERHEAASVLEEVWHTSIRPGSATSASTEGSGDPRENWRHSGLHIQHGSESSLPLGDSQRKLSPSRCFWRLRTGRAKPKSGCQR